MKYLAQSLAHSEPSVTAGLSQGQAGEHEHQALMLRAVLGEWRSLVYGGIVAQRMENSVPSLVCMLLLTFSLCCFAIFFTLLSSLPKEIH